MIIIRSHRQFILLQLVLKAVESVLQMTFLVAVTPLRFSSLELPFHPSVHLELYSIASHGFPLKLPVPKFSKHKMKQIVLSPCFGEVFL